MAAALARALEHHVDGAVDHPARLGDGRHLEVGGVAGRRWRPTARASARRRSAGLGAGRRRRRPGPAARRSSARRSARRPSTSARWPGRTPDRVMPCRATASGSASAAARGSSPAGSGSSSSAARDLVGGERALAPARCRGCRARRTATAGRPGTWRRCRSGRAARPRRRRPAASGVTPAPTAATRPIHSWPCQLPGSPQPSRTMCRSLPQTPHRSTATSTSSSPTAGTGTSSTSSRPGPCSTAAAHVLGPSPRPRHGATPVTLDRRRAGRRPGGPGRPG